MIILDNRENIELPKGLHLKRLEFEGLFDKLFLEDKVESYHYTQQKMKRTLLAFLIGGVITLASIIGIFVVGSHSEFLFFGLPGYVLPAIVMCVASCPTVFVIMYWHTLDINSLRILEERQPIFFNKMHATGLGFKIRKSKRRPELLFTTSISGSTQVEYARFILLSQILSRNDPSKMEFKVALGYDVTAKIDRELSSDGDI